MQNFSGRSGIKDPRSAQIGSMSITLKNRLWNDVHKYLEAGIKYSATGYQTAGFDNKTYNLIVNRLLGNFYGEKITRFNNNAKVLIRVLEKKYDSQTWNEIYDFFEFILSEINKDDRISFTNAIQKTLSDENAGYCLSNGIFIPIDNEADLTEIHDAESESPDEVKEHLAKAKKFLSPRNETPDYQNSIKESISAVEATLRHINQNEKILSENLKELPFDLHTALKDSLNKLYGYTSDASGIRHSAKIYRNKLNTQKPNKSEGRFMLIVCSAFINLLNNKNETKEI